VRPPFVVKPRWVRPLPSGGDVFPIIGRGHHVLLRSSDRCVVRDHEGEVVCDVPTPGLTLPPFLDPDGSFVIQDAEGVFRVAASGKQRIPVARPLQGLGPRVGERRLILRHASFYHCDVLLLDERNGEEQPTGGELVTSLEYSDWSLQELRNPERVLAFDQASRHRFEIAVAGSTATARGLEWDWRLYPELGVALWDDDQVAVHVSREGKLCLQRLTEAKPSHELSLDDYDDPDLDWADEHEASWALMLCSFDESIAVMGDLPLSLAVTKTGRLSSVDLREPRILGEVVIAGFEPQSADDGTPEGGVRWLCSRSFSPFVAVVTADHLVWLHQDDLAPLCEPGARGRPL